ncbi:H-type small acid-soluble spore protein [Peptococcaceae bacterium 1198_IL3148]
MDAQRATEILHSQNTIEVTYQNNSIWIEDVNQSKNTAVVKNLDTDKVSEVPVSALQEQ